MMILDSHIHTEVRPGSPAEQQADLLAKMRAAGVDGGVLLSPDPALYPELSAEDRLGRVLTLCADQWLLFPFFWIDPTRPDALRGVELAKQAGMKGLKIICSGFYPSNPGVLAVCQRAAEYGLPVLFHSGILWDGRDSSRYNRPAEFEALLEIPRLRFALAHVSWPWCDECIAVYGKFLEARKQRPELSCEMFIDLTPGTPPLWRDEVLRKLLCTGYPVLDSLLFGTDCIAEDYDSIHAKKWIALDNSLYEKYCPEEYGELTAHVYWKNLFRFMGLEPPAAQAD